MLYHTVLQQWLAAEASTAMVIDSDSMLVTGSITMLLTSRITMLLTSCSNANRYHKQFCQARLSVFKAIARRYFSMSNERKFFVRSYFARNGFMAHVYGTPVDSVVCASLGSNLLIIV